MKKGKKQKSSLAFIVQPAVTEAEGSQNGECGTPNSFPGNHSQHLSLQPP